MESQVYPSTCLLKHRVTGEQKVQNLLYRDLVEDPWELLHHDSNSQLRDKQPHFCISVPSETEWIGSAAIECIDKHNESYGGSAGLSDALNSLTIQEASNPETVELMKKKLASHNECMSVIVKTYGNDPLLPLNEIIEVWGIIEKVTTETSFNDDDQQVLSVNYLDLLPRVHAIYCEPLRGLRSNPLTRDLAIPRSTITAEAASLRKASIEYLASHLMGDTLAAEYLFLQLFSRVLSHDTAYPVGHYPLNLCQVRNTPSGFTDGLFKALSNFVPFSRQIPLTIESLNTKLWMYPDQTRFSQLDLGLCSGELQLPASTLVVVDETTMSDGTLIERGINNIRQIAETIQSAQVSYNVGFGSTIEKPVDYRFLVLSEGKSMFQIPAVVPLEPVDDFKAAQHGTTSIDPPLFELIRILVEIMKGDDHDISKDMEDIIATEFTQTRRAARDSNLPVDDGTNLMQRLVVAQLIRRSFGKSELDLRCWQMAGELEMMRLARCERLPKSNDAGPSQSGVSVDALASNEAPSR